MKNVLSLIAMLNILTSSVYPLDTVRVKTGWNIIGSVKAGAVPDVLITIPDSLISSSFWGYAPGVGYESTDTLETGLGYWVKAKSDGLIVFNNAPPVDSCKSRAFIDQGRFYHTVKIGNQCWMAENMNAGTMVTGMTSQTDNDTLEKYCYNDSLVNCALYGGLYQWNEAMQYVTTAGAQGICPQGWHLPTWAEYDLLNSALGEDGNAMKAVGQGTGGGTGMNTSGFSGLLAGIRQPFSPSFNNIGSYAYFWGSTLDLGSFGHYMGLYGIAAGVTLGSSHKAYGYSVRCVAD